MITDRDKTTLFCLAAYFLLDRCRIQRLAYKGARSSDRIARRRLAALCKDELIRRVNMKVVNPDNGCPTPVYHLAAKGCEWLAAESGDSRYLAKPTSIPQPNHLFHYLSVADTQWCVRRAVRCHQNIELHEWFNETDIVNPQDDPKDHRRLLVNFSEQPRLFCAPDAAFQLNVRHGTDSHRGVFYLEEDRGTIACGRLAATKTRPYSEVLRRGIHREVFPNANLNRFLVLLVTTTPVRRDNLASSLKPRSDSNLWRVAARTELTPRNFFYDPVWYRPDTGGPVPLINPAFRPDT